MLFERKIVERCDPSSSEVIDSYFVEGYQLENLKYIF